MANTIKPVALFERTETLTQYFEDVRGYDVLSAEEEAKLFEIYFDANSTLAEKEHAKNTIITSSLRYVITKAKTYSNNTNYQDMIQQGNIGLIEAFNNYRMEKANGRFYSFANTYIQRSITQYARDVEPTIYQPNTSKTFHVSSRLRNKFIQMNEREPSDEELMILFNEEDAINQYKKKYGCKPNETELEQFMSSEDYKQTLKEKSDLTQMNIMSIDSTVSDDDDSATVGELQTFNDYSASTNQYEKIAEKEDKMNQISSLMVNLSEREKKIILMYYGVDYPDSYELKEIAAEVGLSVERTRQLFIQAKEKMQETLRDGMRHI